MTDLIFAMPASTMTGVGMDMGMGIAVKAIVRSCHDGRCALQLVIRSALSHTSLHHSHACC